MSQIGDAGYGCFEATKDKNSFDNELLILFFVEKTDF